MGTLPIISALLIISLVTFGIELFYLDPALSPVYPFLLLATIYVVFFLFILLLWLLIVRVVASIKQSKKTDRTEDDEFVIRVTLRAMLSSLVIAFAPVSFIAVSSLHSVQLFDVMAIIIFEILALVYVYKRYPQA